MFLFCHIFLTHLYLLHLNANRNKNWILCSRGETLLEASLLFYCHFSSFSTEIKIYLVTHIHSFQSCPKYQNMRCPELIANIYLEMNLIFTILEIGDINQERYTRFIYLFFEA